MNGPQVHDSQSRRHFDALTREEMEDAIRSMVAMGFGEYVLASATGLSVEAIRAVLAECRKPA